VRLRRGLPDFEGYCFVDGCQDCPAVVDWRHPAFERLVMCVCFKVSDRRRAVHGVVARVGGAVIYNQLLALFDVCGRDKKIQFEHAVCGGLGVGGLIDHHGNSKTKAPNVAVRIIRGVSVDTLERCVPLITVLFGAREGRRRTNRPPCDRDPQSGFEVPGCEYTEIAPVS